MVKNSKTKKYIIDDKVLRYIRTLYESKEDYYKPIKINKLLMMITLNMKDFNRLINMLR